MELTPPQSDTSAPYLHGLVVGWTRRAGLFDVVATDKPGLVTLEDAETFYPDVPVSELLDV